MPQDFGAFAKQFGGTVETPPPSSDFGSFARQFGGEVEQARLRKGPIEPGTVDLFKQPSIPNPDGTRSTVDSLSVGVTDEKGRQVEILLPTVTPDGRHFTGPTAADEAFKEYQKTGLHLGVFETPDDATAYAEQLHNDYAAGKYRPKPMQASGYTVPGSVSVVQQGPLPRVPAPRAATPARGTNLNLAKSEASLFAEPFKGMAEAASGAAALPGALLTPPPVDPRLANAPVVSGTELPVAGAEVLSGDAKDAISDVLEGTFKAMSPTVVAVPVATLAAGLLMPTVRTAIALGVATGADQAARDATKLAGGDEATQRLAGNIAAALAAGYGTDYVIRQTRADIAALGERGRTAREARDAAADAANIIPPEPGDIVLTPDRTQLPARVEERPIEGRPVQPPVEPAPFTDVAVAHGGVVEPAPFAAVAAEHGGIVEAPAAPEPEVVHGTRSIPTPADMEAGDELPATIAEWPDDAVRSALLQAHGTVDQLRKNKQTAPAVLEQAMANVQHYEDELASRGVELVPAGDAGSSPAQPQPSTLRGRVRAWLSEQIERSKSKPHPLPEHDEAWYRTQIDSAVSQIEGMAQEVADTGETSQRDAFRTVIDELPADDPVAARLRLTHPQWFVPTEAEARAIEQAARTPRDRFVETYTKALTDAITKNPKEYAYPVTEVPTVVQKMADAIARGTANVQGTALKAAAKALGLPKSSLSAWVAFFGEKKPVTPQLPPAGGGTRYVLPSFATAGATRLPATLDDTIAAAREQGASDEDLAMLRDEYLKRQTFKVGDRVRAFGAVGKVVEAPGNGAYVVKMDHDVEPRSIQAIDLAPDEVAPAAQPPVKVDAQLETEDAEMLADFRARVPTASDDDLRDMLSDNREGRRHAPTVSSDAGYLAFYDDVEDLVIREMQRRGLEVPKDLPRPARTIDVEPTKVETTAAGEAARMRPEDIMPAPAETVHAKRLAGAEMLTPKQAAVKLAEWTAEAERIGREEDHSNDVVFSLFDRTGKWSEPYEKAGYDVRRYDIANGDDLVEFFPLADITDAREAGKTIVGVLAAPPCTSFAVSGARWWKDQHDQADVEMVEKKYGWRASRYFDTPLDYANTLVKLVELFVEFANPTLFHVMENPVGRIAEQNDLPKPLLTFDPSNFGSPYTKKTLLWGAFNPQLPTANVEPTKGSFMHVLRGDNPAQKAERSITPEGFAYAFFMANHGPRPSAGEGAVVAEQSAKPDKARLIPTRDKDTGRVQIAVEPVARPVDEDIAVARARTEVPAAVAGERAVKLFEAFKTAIQDKTLPKDPRELRKLAASIVGGDPTTYTDDITDAVEAALTLNVTPGGTYRAQLADAHALEAQLPRASRSLEKLDLQQFSTPLPLAVSAATAASVQPGDVVLEPTAGTGHLVASLDPAKQEVRVVEVSKRRADLLRALGFNVTQGDYLAHLAAKETADVIITNPPWGKYSTGKYGKAVGLAFTPGDVAERFIAKSVRDLKPGGRLSAVMPTTMMGPGGVPFRAFLRTQGTIVALVQSPPKAYDTRATTVDSILLVFDKHVTAPAKGSAPVYTPAPKLLEPATWEDYATAIEAIPPREPRRAEPERPAEQPAPGRLAEPAVAAPKPERSGSAGPPERGQPGRAPERGAAVVPPGRHPDVVAAEPGRERARLEPEPAAPRAAKATPGESTRGLSTDALVAYRHAQHSPFFAPYRVRSAIAGVRHPKLVVEARNLAGIDYPPLTLEPTARVARIVREGRVSIEQAEQAMAAVQANVVGHHGYLAADNVGVGKSREIALTILDLMERAKADKRPLRLLVTTKSADNIADLIDREMLQAVLEGDPPGFEIVRVPDMKASKPKAGDTKYEPLPQHEHAIYVTDFYNLAPYRAALQEVGLHGIIGDEAHRFKNADAAVGATWQTLHAQVMLHIPREQQAFAYFTATPAQSVYDYQYLYGLRLWPIDGFDEWVMVVTGQANEAAATKVETATNAGAKDLKAVAENTSTSVVGSDSADTEQDPRQRSRNAGEDVFASRLTPSEAEQIPREWKMLGRFSARDLWREGTEFVVHTAKLPDDAKRRYDTFATLARDIIDAATRFGKMDKSGRANRFGPKAALQAAAKRIQMQPALEEAIRLAKEQIATGHQVVLSVINVSEMDPNEGNIAAAINQINVREVEKTEEGFEDVGEIPEALVARAELLEQAQELGTLPDPLEMIAEAFGADDVAFVVGASAGSRQKQVTDFQAGKRNVAVISAAGSTGISLDHRVLTATGARGRRVFIDVQYEWSASEAIQRYGRVDRASQVSAPKIMALNFGSASEKKFLATVANRMASLGALSKGGAESTGASALEEFEITGQDALEAARNAWAAQSEADRDLWRGRQFRDAAHPEHPAVMTRASMREINLALLWLPTDTANAFWQAFIEERARIREAMGYATEARTKALRGEVLREVPIVEDLRLFQVKNEAGHRFGILQGVVMAKMPRLRSHLLDVDGNIKRSYINFTDTHGERVISGLEIPWGRLKGVAAEFGTVIQGEKIDTPDKALAALKAGDTLILTYRSDGGQPWRLRQRKDEKLIIEGAKMADRDLLMRHGAAYSPVGNFWYVADLAKFLERFPVAEPAAPQTGGASASVGAYAEPSRGVATQTAPAGPGRIPPGHPAGVARPIEFPELVDLARELIGTPSVVASFRTAEKRGEFRGMQGIRLAANLFTKGNEFQAAATLAHEIGHLVDWLPDQMLKRGNILGRLQTLHRFLKHSFTAPDGTTVKLAEVRAELVALSADWRPWDRAKAKASMIAYRDSSRELYADAISVLLNNPALLEREAPIFYKQFFELLDEKPEVQRAYFDLQEVLSGTPEELVARRRAGVRRMFEEGDVTALELERRRLAGAKQTAKDLWFRLKTQLVDKNYAVIDRVRSLAKQGIRIPEDDDPRYLLEERNYLGGKLKAFTERHFAPIFRTLMDEEIAWHAFSEALFYERIIAGDRSELANPRGLSPDTAAELYNSLGRELGSARVKVLRAQTTKFRQVVKDVAEEAHEVGLYTDELYAEMKKNPAYVTFQVIEHMEKGVTSRVHKQVGTLKDIGNVADASILKTLVTLRAIEQQRVKRETFAFLSKFTPDDITDAKTIWNGRGHQPVPSKDPSLKLVTYYEQGKLVGKYVDVYIADALNNESVGKNFAIVSLLRAVNSGLFRPIFTTFNLGFQGFNFARDFMRFWKNVPTMTLRRALRRYVEAVPLAKLRAFGAPKEGMTAKQRQAYTDLLDAEESKMLSVTFNDVNAGRHVEDTQIEDILARYGVGGFNVTPKTPWLKPFRVVLEAIKELGDFIETLPKAAGIYEFKGAGSIRDLSPAQRSFIRRKVGSPDFLAGGTWKPVTNEIFLFSNAIIQAVRSDAEVATEPQTRSGFWWKTASANLLPKLLMFAALVGLLGETLRRLMERVSEYDRTNYLTIPLGEDGKNTVYLRLPQDDSGRLIGGLFWKLLQFGHGQQEMLDTISQIADYGAGQFPSVTPTLQTAVTVEQLASGQNPYDSFRGRNLFTDDEWRARDRHTLNKFVGWEFQNLGGGIVWKFFPGEDRPRDQTTGQKILDLPVVSNIAGRFVRSSNYGEVEDLRAVRAGVQRDEARARLNEKEAIADALRTLKALPANQQGAPARAVITAATRIAVQLYRGDPAEATRRVPEIRQALQLGLLRSESDPVLDALLSATSNKQKLAILQRAIATGRMALPKASGQ